MKYEAVIFDLFGTLVDVYSRREYDKVLAEMASTLSVPKEEFSRLWSGTEKQRGIGVFKDIEANLEYICNELKVTVPDDIVKEAAAIRINMVNKYMTLDKGGMEVLTGLKSRGYKLALISNCSPDAPVVWEKLPYKTMFDVAIFSSQVGLRKPDPQIYQLAAEKLAVEPLKCLYIGDGDGDELFGAAGAGMNPVLVRYPDEDRSDAMRSKPASREWDGPVITSLKEVLKLLE